MSNDELYALLNHQPTKGTRMSERWVVTVTRTVVQSVDVVVEDVGAQEAVRDLAGSIDQGDALFDESVFDMVHYCLDEACIDEYDVAFSDASMCGSPCDPDVVITRAGGRAVSARLGR